jgi:PQQ-dependent dehydrogenase (methanol/ethanol family)
VLNRARLLGLMLLPIAFASGLSAAEKIPPLLAKAANVNNARLLKGTDDTSAWAHYGGSYNEQRFSPLKKINDTNVKDLGLAWYADYDTNQNQHGSPLYVDGVLYVSTARNVVHAFDARDGKRLWTYTPLMIPNPNLGLVNRGIAAYNGKIYMGMLDAHLVAIDAKTGKPAWNIDTVPESLGLGAMRKNYSITMAPRVAKGLVFVGGSGGEFGVRGWIAAYDAETGKEVWRFWTVPGDPAKPDNAVSDPALKKALATWPDRIEYWKQGGGGTIWDAAVYDPVTDLLYFGTGNGTPWNREMRDPSDGDNLYVASIVAVKASTGEYVWHYQETPGDSWDYDAIRPLVTADVTINGEKKHVIIQPSKNGLIYVIEAATGKLISGDPFTEVTWATGVDVKTGRPIEVPGAPRNRTLQHRTRRAGRAHLASECLQPRHRLHLYTHLGNLFGDGAAAAAGFRSAAADRLRWSHRSRHAQAACEAGRRAGCRPGIPSRARRCGPRPRVRAPPAACCHARQPGVWATVAQLGLNAKNGDKLWTFEAQTAVYAAPITYQLNGVQYIAAMSQAPAATTSRPPMRMLVFCGWREAAAARALYAAAVESAADCRARDHRAWWCGV